MEQHSRVTQRTAYRDELPELSELLNQQLEQEAARWQAVGQQSRDKLQELIAPVTRLAQEKWAQDLYFQLSEELRKDRQDRWKDIPRFDEIMAEAVGQFANIARELDGATVRLAEHGHSGGKELQEKVAKWLRDLSELKGKVKAGVVEITGTSLDNFSRGGMLARGMSEWAEDLKQSYLQEKRPEDRAVAAELFEHTLMEIVEENRTHFAKESDPEAKRFLKRLTLALNHAAENALVYPPTPEEILASSRSIPDDIRLWAEQKIVSGAISAALRGGFKLLVNTTSLPLRVAVRAGRTTYQATRGVQAIRRGVKLGQSQATKIENKYINQEVSKATIRFTLSISPLVGYGIATAITGKRIYDGDLNKVTKKVLVDMTRELPWVAVDASINFAVKKYTEHSIKQAIQNALDEQADKLALRINKEIESKNADINVEIVPQEMSVSPAETAQSTPEPIIRRKRDISSQMLTDNDEHDEENKKYFSTIKKNFNRNENDDIEPFDETDKKELSRFVLNAALNRSPHSGTGSSNNILTEQNIENFPEIIRERFHYLKKIEPNITDDDTRKAIFLNLKRFIHRNINKLSFNNIYVLLNSLYSISDENNDFDADVSKIKAKHYKFKKHFHINRKSYVKIKKTIYDEEKENKPGTIKLPSDEIIATEEFSSVGINNSIIRLKNKLKEISNKNIENLLLVKEGDELLKFSSLEIKSLIKYLHLINNENVITKIKNHIVKNSYEDIIFSSNLAQKITEDSKLFLGPASEEELTAVIYQLTTGKKFDNLSLTRIYNKFLFSKERENPFTKAISKNKPEGYFTISDFKKSGDAESRSKFNQQFYDYRDKYNQYDASILAGSIITSSNITVEEFTQAPKSIQTFAVFGKTRGVYISKGEPIPDDENPAQYIPGRVVLMQLSSGRYLLSSNLLGGIKSIILSEQEGNNINEMLRWRKLVDFEKGWFSDEADPRYKQYKDLYYFNKVNHLIIKPLYGADWSNNPISKISHQYFTLAQDSKAAKIEINASSTVASTLAQGMEVAQAAYVEDLHQAMDETSTTWKIIRGFIPFYNTIYNASTDSEYIIDSGDILLDLASIIPIFKTTGTVGKSASEVIALGRSALKAGITNGLRGHQLFKYVSKQVAPELLSASSKSSLLITKAFYDAIEPVPIRSSLKGLYKGIKNDLNLTSLEGISSKVLMTADEKANLKLSNDGIWKNDSGESYIKDAKGEFYQVERNKSNQGWVLINGDRKTPISNSGGRWGVKKEDKKTIKTKNTSFPTDWRVNNIYFDSLVPDNIGIYTVRSENWQSMQDYNYYIKHNDNFYQVRYDESNNTLRLVNPTASARSGYFPPIRLNKNNVWEFHTDVGLKGGGLLSLESVGPKPPVRPQGIPTEKALELEEIAQSENGIKPTDLPFKESRYYDNLVLYKEKNTEWHGHVEKGQAKYREFYENDTTPVSKPIEYQQRYEEKEIKQESAPYINESGDVIELPARVINVNVKGETEAFYKFRVSDDGKVLVVDNMYGNRDNRVTRKGIGQPLRMNELQGEFIKKREGLYKNIEFITQEGIANPDTEKMVKCVLNTNNLMSVKGKTIVLTPDGPLRDAFCAMLTTPNVQPTARMLSTYPKIGKKIIEIRIQSIDRITLVLGPITTMSV
ncbi:hypothetical protein [Photorhabdus australis]|uniref:hypothetical protein n=1 Tax=Photorhabdus australis TaxID=286156 RepID=UPI000A4F30A9|nr:hypothetical protein [Photorhabdus australis]